MFTKKELAALVPRTIFERGRAYYEDDEAVGSIRQQGDVFTAKVRGTATYRVSLQIRATGPPEIQCNCPYDYGPVCKHGIALGLAVLGLVADAGIIAQPAPPEKRSKAEKSAHILKGAWARTSDKQKLAFLRQLLAQKPKQLRRFLAAFEFDEKALAKLPAQPHYVARPTTAPTQRPAPRRPLSLAEQAQQLLEQQRGPELLPLVLALNWLQNPPAHDSYTLPYLLGEAARFQPEATLDAVMERFEGFLEDKSLRNYLLYSRLVACLKALALLPALTQQVQLFASELMQQYRPLRTLQTSLGRAGFVIIAPEEATGLPLKPLKRPPGSDVKAGLPKRRPKPETAALPPKRRGRPRKDA
ncbi:hypothetical protein [Hymenobacter antarcticus]|uniref:SWIM-type domain-containing protein n=1 Tax=Hymenobacter antarcticus TaxID=486270 RepID=A0ABP7QBB0_9BACT